MLRLSHVVLSAFIVVVFAPSPIVSAQATAPMEPAGYRQAIDAAVVEYKDGSYDEARALFYRAHELYPNARTMRGVGLSEFALRRYAEALTWFTRALGEQERPLPPDLAEQTRQLVTRCQSYVGRARLTVEPTEAAVRVDGAQALLDAQGALLMDIGEHTLEVSAESYQPEIMNLRIRGGEMLDLKVELERNAERSSALTGTSPQRALDKEKPRSLRRNPWLWTSVGILAAGAIGTVLGITLQDEGGARSSGGSTGISLPGP